MIKTDAFYFAKFAKNNLSGLGCALALAGVMFARNYLCYHNLMEKEQDA
ncbi:hypothetical protein [Anaerotignum faecicola]